MIKSSKIDFDFNYQYKIAVVICYFGKLPWYFDFFVHSCGFNPSIDFYIVTDDRTYCKPLPDNVVFVYSSINAINELASKSLGIKTNILNGYKLCDFKPAYGLLFPELIQGYDFWGQGDLDVIYGDIKSFITEDILNEFDFISVRHDYATGCFTLHRNNSLINNIFKKSRDYLRVFSSSKHYCFDECNWAYNSLAEGKSIFEVETEIESFTQVIKAAHNNKEINALFDFFLIEGTPGKITFDNGKIIYKRQYEGILYHLVRLKRIYSPKNLPERIPDKYHISSKRIYFSREKNNHINLEK